MHLKIENQNLFTKYFFARGALKMKKLCSSCTTLIELPVGNDQVRYFFRYITSLTSFTIFGTSGSAAATRFGA